MNKSQILFITSLIFGILVIIFALTNAGPVPVKLFFYTFESSQALIIFISVLIGAIITLSLGIRKYLSINKSEKQLLKENENLKIEIERLLDEIKELKSFETTENNDENNGNEI
ncbi:MAG: uncharacterized protein JG776_701 [Caloramator sp.]|jgi:uncharacterized integral membrane protein|uniref:LapA family protein n=1 Tax=Caloramator sp. TaxID=1871330 RepID=UPI001E176D38|nr:LapA family protein [Caloramator sp.]MBZ4663019.1 uncharacterized protein [Caloramator sp.]